ncbi:MAG TPA: hypothetical protein VMT11_09965 [Myxococcaceae bacterium]|nr:hypothetical protein [Myxococcaceae bacterium]
MRRVPPLVLLAAVLLGAPAFAQRVAEKPPALVPAWLPREVAILTFFQNGNITPELRIAWHIPVVQQRIDSLNLIIEGGGGWALGKRSVTNENADPPLTELHQWHIQGGIAYEGDWAQGWHIGGRITVGVTIFGANYSTLSGPVHEDTSTAGTVEGRLEGGYRFGRVVIGVTIGVLQPWSKDPRLYSPNDIGGFSSGIFFNWR